MCGTCQHSGGKQRSQKKQPPGTCPCRSVLRLVIKLSMPVAARSCSLGRRCTVPCRAGASLVLPHRVLGRRLAPLQTRPAHKAQCAAARHAATSPEGGCTSSPALKDFGASGQCSSPPGQQSGAARMFRCRPAALVEAGAGRRFADFAVTKILGPPPLTQSHPGTAVVALPQPSESSAAWSRAVCGW